MSRMCEDVWLKEERETKANAVCACVCMCVWAVRWGVSSVGSSLYALITKPPWTVLIWESHSHLSFEGSLHHSAPGAPVTTLAPPHVAPFSLFLSDLHMWHPSHIKASTSLNLHLCVPAVWIDQHQFEHCSQSGLCAGLRIFQFGFKFNIFENLKFYNRNFWARKEHALLIAPVMVNVNSHAIHWARTMHNPNA